MKVDGPSKMDDSDRILLSLEYEFNLFLRRDPIFHLKRVRSKVDGPKR